MQAPLQTGEGQRCSSERSAGHVRTLGLGLSSWLSRTARSLVDRVSSRLLFCLFRNKNAMLRGAKGPDDPRLVCEVVGEVRGCVCRCSCYLDGESMRAV